MSLLPERLRSAGNGLEYPVDKGIPHKCYVDTGSAGSTLEKPRNSNVLFFPSQSPRSFPYLGNNPLP